MLADPPSPHARRQSRCGSEPRKTRTCGGAYAARMRCQPPMYALPPFPRFSINRQFARLFPVKTEFPHTSVFSVRHLWVPGRPRGPQHVRAACTREPHAPSQQLIMSRPVRRSWDIVPISGKHLDFRKINFRKLSFDPFPVSHNWLEDIRRPCLQSPVSCLHARLPAAAYTAGPLSRQTYTLSVPCTRVFGRSPPTRVL